MKILLLVLFTGLAYSNTSLANIGIDSTSNKTLGFKNYPSLLRLAQNQEAAENDYNLDLKEEKYAKNHKKMIGETRYVLGGVASMWGFGLGQFIQGKVIKGVISLGLDIVFGFTIIGHALGSPSRDKADQKHRNTIAGYAALGFLGSRVYQIWDAWAQPTAVEGGYLVESGTSKGSINKLSFELPILAYSF